jgi:CRP-like cAMP-binding protein
MRNALSRSSGPDGAPPQIVLACAVRAPVKLFAPPVPEPRSLEPGERLFSVGDRADGLFEVREGFLMALRGLPGDRRQILDIAGPGRVVGFSAAGRRDCDAVALGPVVVATADLAPFDRHSAMLAEIERLRDLATLLGRKTALERVASFLVGMSAEDGEAIHRIMLPVSRQEIADYLGLVIETVCRNFVALKKAGLIANIGRDRVEILDRKALMRIANGDGSADI